MAQTLIAFDYSQLGKDAKAVREVAAEIKMLCKTAAQQVIAIGQLLIDVKEKLPHGQFGSWIVAEFGWTHATACNFMNVSQRFSDNSKFLNFGTSALYLLANPSVSDEAVAEAIHRADHGEEITHKVAKEIVAKHKPDTIPIKQSIPVHAELVEGDDDAAKVQSILRGEHKDKYEARQDDEPEAKETRTFKTDAELLIEKVQKLINDVDRMAAERMGHNAKSRAVVNHFNDSIPLIKAMNKTWRN
jgi:hypothetical protein